MTQSFNPTLIQNLIEKESYKDVIAHCLKTLTNENKLETNQYWQALF